MQHDERVLAWQQTLSARDFQIALRSNDELGSEREIYAAAAFHAESILQGALWLRSQSGSHEAKVLYAAHAFNLLISSWESLTHGRYDAALHNIRSIDECLEFIRALMLQPSLAGQLRKGKLDVDDARKVVKDGLNKMQAGAGDEWDSQRPLSWIHHKFAHATLPAIRSTVVTAGPGGRGAVAPGGGLVDPPKLRGVGVALAEVALDLMRTLVLAFGGSVSGWWTDEGATLDTAARNELNIIADQFGFGPEGLDADGSDPSSVDSR